jgi:4-oxalocrotonate tautomerase
MPHIQITMLRGRTTEQKRKIVQRLTDAMVEEAKTSREAVVVTIIEVEREDYASGGVLMSRPPRTYCLKCGELRWASSAL